MDNIDVPSLVARLGSDLDPVRKMAAFKLQSNIGDPSFADTFDQAGGLTALCHLVMSATGNTLAYSLASFSRLLEVDKGWDCIDQDLVERVVELVVTHPLVNILRGAMSILVAIVSHPQNLPGSGLGRARAPGAFGFRALKPAIAVYPQFLEMLVSRLSSADHALCANALQLINSLMRDAVTNGGEEGGEWERFIRRLQDLGVIKAVYVLMQSSALQDLAQPLLEFQGLTKVLLRRWREVPLDLEKSEHRRALKGLHLASGPPTVGQIQMGSRESGEGGRKRTHHPEKWRRLGFESESPGWEFADVGFLGMMDLTDFVRKDEEGFRKLLQEQSMMSPPRRCPIARSSLTVTAILLDHFEISSSSDDDSKSYLALDSRTNFDKIFRPLILQWSRLHTGGLYAFLRLWKATGAEMRVDLDDEGNQVIDDAEFEKVGDLVRILIEQVIGQASRTKDLSVVEEELSNFGCKRLRELQMEVLELGYEEGWGVHLRQVRAELQNEALQFIREQRIRCLLRGAWFPNLASSNPPPSNGPITAKDLRPTTAQILPSKTTILSYRYVRLSHNRRFLHHSTFDTSIYLGDPEYEPGLEILTEKLDLLQISTVESNITATPAPARTTRKTTTTSTRPSTSASSHSSHTQRRGSTSSTSSLSLSPTAATAQNPTSTSTSTSPPTTTSIRLTLLSSNDTPLLTLHPSTPSLASEWTDALLLLLGQTPITAETGHLVDVISQWGLRIRLLGLRGGVGLRLDGAGQQGREGKGIEVPSREGLDLDEERGDAGFWYDVFGGGQPQSV